MITATHNHDALMTLIDEELTSRLSRRVLECQTPEEAAKEFINLDLDRIEDKAFRLIGLDEEVISDAVYVACDYVTVKALAAEMMQHGPAPKPVAVAAGVFDDSDIPF